MSEESLSAFRRVGRGLPSLGLPLVVTDMPRPTVETTARHVPIIVVQRTRHSAVKLYKQLFDVSPPPAQARVQANWQRAPTLKLFCLDLLRHAQCGRVTLNMDSIPTQGFFGIKGFVINDPNRFQECACIKCPYLLPPKSVEFSKLNNTWQRAGFEFSGNCLIYGNVTSGPASAAVHVTRIAAEADSGIILGQRSHEHTKNARDAMKDWGEHVKTLSAKMPPELLGEVRKCGFVHLGSSSKAFFMELIEKAELRHVSLVTNSDRAQGFFGITEITIHNMTDFQSTGLVKCFLDRKCSKEYKKYSAIWKRCGFRCIKKTLPCIFTFDAKS